MKAHRTAHRKSPRRSATGKQAQRAFQFGRVQMARHDLGGDHRMLAAPRQGLAGAVQKPLLGQYFSRNVPLRATNLGEYPIVGVGIVQSPGRAVPAAQVAPCRSGPHRSRALISTADPE